jgi:AraC family transcriptional regulator
MEISQFAIKNMVCDRCIRVVREELQKLGMKPTNVKLGEVEIEGLPSAIEIDSMRAALKASGFELIEDKKQKLIEAMKNLVILQVHQNQESKPLPTNYSDYLSEKLSVDYVYLSTLFSSSEGITIEKYIIAQKIERVKELLAYQELTLSEIAYQMGYSSVHHLSNQFKKVTGLTPKDYKLQAHKLRKALDKIA